MRDTSICHCVSDVLGHKCTAKHSRHQTDTSVESGKKGCPFTIGYLNLNFNEISSSNVELNKITALTKVMGYPSTFYIRPIDMTGERSVVTEGVASVAVYVSELRLK